MKPFRTRKLFTTKDRRGRLPTIQPRAPQAWQWYLCLRPQTRNNTTGAKIVGNRSHGKMTHSLFLVRNFLPKSYLSYQTRTTRYDLGTMFGTILLFLCLFGNQFFIFTIIHKRCGPGKRTHLDCSITFATDIRFTWFLHRLKTEIQGFQTVQKSPKTDSCSKRYGRS